MRVVPGLAHRIDALLKAAPRTEGAMRLHFFASYWLGMPYTQQPMDVAPNTRADLWVPFDCVTYLNTVLALYSAQVFWQFEYHYGRLTYYSGNPSYLNRLHFMSVDWNPVCTQLGYVSDATAGYAEAVFQSVWINKKKWLGQQRDVATGNESQSHVHRCGSLHWMPQYTGLAYLPWRALFVDNCVLPTFAVVQIIKKPIMAGAKRGVVPLVSHVGFLLQYPDKGPRFLHASSDLGAIVDVCFWQYMDRARNCDDKLGIHLLALHQCAFPG